MISTLLCVLPAGLQPPLATLVLSRCCPGSTTLSSLLHGLSDCLPRYFLHLCYVGAYALRNSLPLAVWLRCRFIQAAIALFFIPSSVALLLMLVVGLRCVFCFDFRFLYSRSSPSIVVASACHHSVRLHSPALRPVFYQLARTGFFLWKVADSDRQLILSFSRCRRCGRMP